MLNNSPGKKSNVTQLTSRKDVIVTLLRSFASHTFALVQNLRKQNQMNTHENFAWILVFI